MWWGAGLSGPYVTGATVGRIVDLGIKDANNMGAAMAPAAVDTLERHFQDFGVSPADYDLIVTGDLGALGKQIVLEQTAKDGYDLSQNYDDCGVLLFSAKKQDVHSGGSGCGCSASVLCGVSAAPDAGRLAEKPALLRDGRAALAGVDVAGRIYPRHLPRGGHFGGEAVKQWNI